MVVCWNSYYPASFHFPLGYAVDPSVGEASLGEKIVGDEDKAEETKGRFVLFLWSWNSCSIYRALCIASASCLILVIFYRAFVLFS